MTLVVVEGGRGPQAVERVHDAVVGALRTWRSGGSPAPLFVVAPGTDPEAIRAEVGRLEVPEGTGLLMRTSGSTTGTGKIVAISWESLTASAKATHEAFGGPGRWAAQLPLEHIAGLQTVARSAINELDALDAGESPQSAARFRPIYLDLSDPRATRAALTSAAVRTYLSLVPTQLLRVLRTPELLVALREAVFLVGGAGTPEHALTQAREAGLDVHTSYGMTETCGGCVYDGRPIGDTKIVLAGNGRISLRSSAVATGYLWPCTASATAPVSAVASAFEPTDFDPPAPLRTPGTPATHHTKDAGRLVETPDGNILDVLGRIDDAITTGGLTVMPRLIEESLARAGREAIVVGVPHLEWGEAVAAVVDDTNIPSQSCDITAMRSWVKLDLGPWWAPTYVVGLSEIGGQLPHTASGKVDRRQLRELVSDYLGL